MLKMVDGTGIIGVDMVCPLGVTVSPPQPPNYDKVEMEGAGSLMLPNSLKAPLERVELTGNSVQGENPAPENPQEIKSAGRKSKNLLIENISVFTVQDNIAYIPLPEGHETKLYTMLIQKKPGENDDVGFTCGFYDKSNMTATYSAPCLQAGNLVTGNGIVNSKIGVNHFVCFSPADSRFFDIYNVMYAEGKETTLDYEPYGYLLDVKVTGKNLFDQSKLISGFINMTTGAFEESANTSFANSLILDKPILLKSGQTLVTSVADRFAQNFLRYRTYRKDGTFLINNEPISFSYKATEDLYVIALFYNGMSEEEKKSLQIEISDKSTSYEPYTEQTLTLTSDRPITKWDKLVEQGGEYGWLYKHRIVNDLSALVKDSEPIYGKDGEKYFSVSLQGALFNYDYNKIYSVAGLCPKDSKIHYVPKPMIQSVVIYVSDTDTIMTAKEHMHYKVIYETTESQFAPLSESEQTQLRNLHSYNGTTHVFVDSGEVPCGIKLTYRKEI
nr:MAG TPA: hypothetical protein [Bacteriophage sp.]